jgi:hypothetical protein
MRRDGTDGTGYEAMISLLSWAVLLALAGGYLDGLVCRPMTMAGSTVWGYGVYYRTD